MADLCSVRADSAVEANIDVEKLCHLYNALWSVWCCWELFAIGLSFLTQSLTQIYFLLNPLLNFLLKFIFTQYFLLNTYLLLTKSLTQFLIQIYFLLNTYLFLTQSYSSPCVSCRASWRAWRRWRNTSTPASKTMLSPQTQEEGRSYHYPSFDASLFSTNLKLFLKEN